MRPPRPLRTPTPLPQVYAAERAADAAERDAEHGPMRKDIEPLAAVDHSTVDYVAIEKNFYVEAPEIAALSAEATAALRRELDVRVAGANVTKPCRTFAQFGFDDALMRNIAAHGYTEPTGIQKQVTAVRPAWVARRPRTTHPEPSHTGRACVHSHRRSR